ncbi:hypothetical protein KY362_04770 [Candidatus Woesearchaeota archaeon]|nr:hypothetical protein [Candidatus Woesearchaeota archaeon]
MKHIYLMLMVMLLACATCAYAQDAVPELFGTAAQPNTVELVLFYGAGCPHCAKEEAWLEDMKEKYPTLKVFEYEVYSDNDNRKLMFELAERHGVEVSGVPATFINGKVITGFSDRLAENIEQEITYCLYNDCQRCRADELKQELCEDPILIEGESSPHEDPEKTTAVENLTIPVVIGAAVVDAINPCAFAVLIILLSTILAAGKRRRVILAGLAFTLSIFISYFLMGLGLYSAIQAAGLTSAFYAIVATLAIIVGLFNLKDYLWYGKWFIMEVPRSWRPKMKMLLKGVTSVPGAFLVGFVISLFLLPCTSGPYIVILGLLAEVTTRSYAMALLVLYNLIFVLPMLIITFAIYFGFTTTERAEHWRTRKLKVLHLIAGIIMVCLGIGMFIAMVLGYV